MWVCGDDLKIVYFLQKCADDQIIKWARVTNCKIRLVFLQRCMRQVVDRAGSGRILVRARPKSAKSPQHANVSPKKQQELSDYNPSVLDKFSDIPLELVMFAQHETHVRYTKISPSQIPTRLPNSKLEI